MWRPLYLEADGVESCHGTDPVKISIDISQILMVAPLHDGVVTHAISRSLDHSKYTIDDPTAEMGLDTTLGGALACVSVVSSRVAAVHSRLVAAIDTYIDEKSKGAVIDKGYEFLGIGARVP